MSYRFSLTHLAEDIIAEDSGLKSEIDNMLQPNQSVFIVGWRPDSAYELFDYVAPRVRRVTLIEIHQPNVNAFNSGKYSNVISVCDDVRNIAQYFLPSDESKVLIWQHGPEHLEKTESMKLLLDFKHLFDYILIETPGGFLPQDEMYGNQYERHLSAWERSDYEQLGFKHTINRFQAPAVPFIIGFYRR